nr:phosphoglycolate phosphatase [Candidatus Cloacimonadota bacterium]
MQEIPLIHSVIFDLDGTLLDTLKDIANAMNKGLADLGYPQHPIEAYEAFIGHGQNELARRALPETSRDPKNIIKLSKLFLEYYAQEWAASTKPFIGIIYLIQVAISRKIKLGILSNKAHYFTKKMIRHYFRGAMLDYPHNPFRVYSGEQPGRPTKPDPAIALEILSKLNCKPQYSALVGDMPVDIQTAKNAGMIAIGAEWGYDSKQNLIEAGADMTFESPTQLAHYLGGLPLY